MSPRRTPFPVLAAAAFAVAAPAIPAASEVSFNRDVRPVLSKKCMACHGPDGSKRKGHLRLDQAGGEDGAYRERDGSRAVVPGDVAGSELWHRLTTDDPDDVMPPPDAHVKPVTAEERELIRRWIEGGAGFEDFWAFAPPGAPDVPEVADPNGWAAGAIDRFALARMAEEGFTPSPEADRRTLVRRLTLDLTGLPPTPDEIQAFLEDRGPGAYGRLVDRLLASPHYGEHLAKYWLDLVRFADTNGIHHDHYREMTPYRDWVIRAFNDNLPFDDFVRYQIAGDLYPEPVTDQLVASGFNRLHLVIDRGTALPEESFTKNVIDRVTAVGTAFMGLTLQCAVCHDHKYDPVTMRDFYQVFAFFNNFDGEPETGGRSGTDFKRGLQPPYIDLPTPEQEQELARLDARIAELVAASGRVENLADGCGAPAGEGATAADADLDGELERARESRDAVLLQVPASLVMKERAEPRPAHILVRGAYDQPGEVVGRDTPAFLPPLEKRGELADRMDFANWLVAPGHPLTARVAVNRLWQQFFGVGIVRTSEDFGTQGEWPSHPGLLDYLATEFRASGWDVKALVRSIVTSATYRQSSAAPPDRFRDDPDNRLLARGSRFRLDSEVIRDQVLAVGGLLSPAMFGRSVKPPQPDGLWELVAMPSSYPNKYVADTGESAYRRSIYTFWKRTIPPPQMSIFDAPTREACIARRERTNTPLQALLMMNEAEYFSAAMAAAAGLLARENSDADRLRSAFELVTSQLPDAQQLADLAVALGGFRRLYGGGPELARDMVAAHGRGTGADPGTAPGGETELAAWTMVVHSLLNLDATKTRE